MERKEQRNSNGNVYRNYPGMIPLGEQLGLRQSRSNEKKLKSGNLSTPKIPPQKPI